MSEKSSNFVTSLKTVSVLLVICIVCGALLALCNDLFYIDEHKTGKMILAPITIASILSDSKYYVEFERFGKLLGRLFQMTDDILDVTGDFNKLGKNVGKDEEKNKLTCVRVYGLEGAKVRADMCAADCHAILEGIDGDTSFLHELVDYVLNRKN